MICMFLITSAHIHLKLSVGHLYPFNIVSFTLTSQWASVRRWYRDLTRIPMSTVSVPQLVETPDGFVETDRDIAVIWPWDMLQWWDVTGGLTRWIANEPHNASRDCQDYVQNLKVVFVWNPNPTNVSK